MNTTTHSLFPTASRASAAGYSPDTASTLPTDDKTSSKSFDELCPEDDRDARAHLERSDSRDPTDASCEAHADEAEPGEDAPEDECDEETRRRRGAGQMIAIPSILATLREATPVAAALAAPSAGPAEIAEVSTATPSTSPTTARAAGADVDGPGAGVARGLVAGRQGRKSHAEGANREFAAEGKGTLAASSNRSSPHLATVAGAATPTAAGAAGSKADAAELAPPQASGTRTPVAKGTAEKTAAQPAAQVGRELVSGPQKFLNADDQVVTSRMRSNGTRAAMSVGTMNPSTNTAQRLGDSTALAHGTPTALGQGAWTETLSVDWKGWTNGGGERTSTAAQFSHLGEKISHLAVTGAPAAGSVGRVATPATPVAPVVPTVPVDASEALAPIHSAIERLIVHGREQLALTVRFEQGGSLSIKLAMQNGEIATQIQTDVPGLEAALKSAWGDLAQDWNSRGWKLGSPEFSSTSATYHNRHDAMADGRSSGRNGGRDADESPAFAGRGLSPARLKHTGSVALSGLETLRAAARARSGIHTWA